MRGSTPVTFLDLIRDTVRTHGIRWSLHHYGRKMPTWELRFWMKQAIR